MDADRDESIRLRGDGCMMEKIRKKLKNQAGESLAETLVSLLIAALALVMLAGAISSASGVIIKSRDKLDKYYSANEENDGVVRMASGGTPGSMKMTDSSGLVQDKTINIIYFKNDEFAKTPVVAYKYNPSETGGTG